MVSKVGVNKVPYLYRVAKLKFFGLINRVRVSRPRRYNSTQASLKCLPGYESHLVSRDILGVEVSLTNSLENTKIKQRTGLHFTK